MSDLIAKTKPKRTEYTQVINYEEMQTKLNRLETQKDAAAILWIYLVGGAVQGI